MPFDIFQEVIRGSFTVGAAGFASWLAMKVFLHQKEFELVKQRYLEGGIDEVAAQHEAVFGIFNHNWARCLQLTKMFRDTKGAFDIAELQRGFLYLDASKFCTIAHHRIGVLTGTQLYWNVYQLALSYAVNANSSVTVEIPEVYRLKITTDKFTDDFDEIAKTSFERLKKLQLDSHQFSELTLALETLANTLQTGPFTFETVKEFRNNSAIILATEGLDKQFAQSWAE
jgi:hypothetical protein